MPKILAFAKLNLYLRVTGKLPDGFHSLQTVMQTVTLCDRIEINPSQSGKVTVTCSDRSLSGEDNIAYTAARRFLEASGNRDGFDIYIKKAIPVASGMGGGSSDAAAVLNALNGFYGSPFKLSRLEEIGLSVGADVPFLIRGGCSLAEGKGEKLTPLEKEFVYYYVAVKHGDKTATADRYAALDRLHPANGDGCDFSRLVNDIGYFYGNARNDFVGVFPPDAGLAADFAAAGAETVMLSGSGSACFAAFRDIGSAISAYKTLAGKYRECFLLSDTAAGSITE